MANVYQSWGKYDKAMELYEKSLAIRRELKDRAGEGKTLNNMGLVYRSWGKYDKAMELYEKSLAICRELKDRAGEGRTLNNMGEVLVHRMDTDRPADLFFQSIAIYKELKIAADLPTNSLGNLRLDQGRIAEAEPLIKDAGYSRSLGRLALIRQDFRGATEQYEKLLKRAEKNRHSANLFTAYTGLASAAEGTSDRPKAAEYYCKAVEHVEEMRSSLAPAQRENFFDVRVAGFYRTAPYEGLSRALIKLDKPVEAFKESEAIRARLFAEAISKRYSVNDPTVPKAVRDKDEQLKDQLGAMTKNHQQAYEKGNQQTIRVLEPQVKQLKAELTAHIDMLRKQYPLFAATRYPQPMDLSQTGLKDNEWVLSLDVTEPGLIIYLTKGKTVAKALFKPIARKDVDELVRRFRVPLEPAMAEVDPGKSDKDRYYLVMNRMKSFDFQTGKKLADLLLSDVLPLLPKDVPVIIVPGGSLGIVPFEMLVLNTGGKVATDKERPYAVGAEFFGDRNSISYYQSITALTLARTFGKQKVGADKSLVMDDPVFDPNDIRLQQMARDKRQAMLNNAPDKLLAAIKHDFKKELNLEFPRLTLTHELGVALKNMDPNRTDEHTAMEASKQLLFQRPLDRYSAITFATHGYFGKELPGIMEPVLVLTLVNQPEGSDGFLRLSEVMGLKLNADIVALTACQTGLGRHMSGEGTMGMGRAFQYAGAKSVLMSLWSVSEAGSVKLVENFFRHVKEGKNKLEALRLARREIRAAGFDHPYYWAPFILVGEVQ